METQQPKEEKSKLETKITKQLSKTFKQTKPKQTQPKKLRHKCSPGALEEIKVTSRCPYCQTRKSLCYIHLDTEGESEDGYECERCDRGLEIGYRSLGGPHTCRQKPNFSARRR
jgi:hypothetical protein